MTWLKLLFVGCQLCEAFGIPEVVNTDKTTFEYLRKEECRNLCNLKNAIWRILQIFEELCWRLCQPVWNAFGPFCIIFEVKTLLCERPLLFWSLLGRVALAEIWPYEERKILRFWFYRFHLASIWSKWLAVAKRILPEAWEFERDIPLHCTCQNSGVLLLSLYSNKTAW